MDGHLQAQAPAALTPRSVVSPAGNGGQRPVRLLEQVRWQIRQLHYSRRTEDAYVYWCRAFIRFHGLRHPAQMGVPEMEAFLGWQASERRVATSTHRQALSALLFLYAKVLRIDLPRLGDGSGSTGRIKQKESVAGHHADGHAGHTRSGDRISTASAGTPRRPHARYDLPMPSIGGRHRKRGTDLLVRYCVNFHEVVPGRVVYYACFTEGDMFEGGFSLGLADGETSFDPVRCPVDDAVRAAVTRYIDEHDLVRGAPLKRPHPSVRYW